MANIYTITGRLVTKKYINILDNYIDIMHGANKENHSNKRR